VSIAGIEDKRQITAVFAATDFFPPKLIRERPLLASIHEVP